MLKLYNAPHSTCSQKVRICLHEKGLPFEDIRLDLGKAKDQLKPEYLKLNPNGVVPTLVDDGNVIINSSVICEYLDEKYPAPKLTPDDIVAARQDARLDALSRGGADRGGAGAVVQHGLPAALCRPRRRALPRRAVGRPADPQALLSPHEPRPASSAPTSRPRSSRSTAPARAWRRRWQSGPWLMGEQYTIADIVVTPSIDRMADLGFSSIWDQKYPRVTDWYARMQARPAFQQTFYPGTRMSETFPLRPAIVD